MVMQSPIDNQLSQNNRKRKHQAIILAASALAVQATINTSLAFLMQKEPRPKQTSILKGGKYIQELLERVWLVKWLFVQMAI
jgi:hypothetical protein